MARRNNGGFAGMSFEKIMIQQAFKSFNSPVYCRYCGMDIKQPTRNSMRFETGPGTASWYNEWEIENEAHIKCHQENLGGYRR
jgi:hypothetical protein